MLQKKYTRPGSTLSAVTKPSFVATKPVFTSTEYAQSSGGAVAGPQGPQGIPGITPVKGVDYFDGAPGTPGSKGDKGDTGSTGTPGQNGSDASVTKINVEAVLTGEISSHTHAGGSGGLTQAQILTRQL